MTPQILRCSACGATCSLLLPPHAPRWCRFCEGAVRDIRYALREQIHDALAAGDHATADALQGALLLALRGSLGASGRLPPVAPEPPHEATQ